MRLGPVKGFGNAGMRGAPLSLCRLVVVRREPGPTSASCSPTWGLQPIAFTVLRGLKQRP